MPSAKTEFNRLAAKLSRTIKEIKSESLNVFLSKLGTDESADYSLYKTTK